MRYTNVRNGLLQEYVRYCGGSIKMLFYLYMLPSKHDNASANNKTIFYRVTSSLVGVLTWQKKIGSFGSGAEEIFRVLSLSLPFPISGASPPNSIA